jgi:hypothetical protein
MKMMREETINADRSCHFATAWVARTRLAPPAVVFYAGVFACIDIAYNAFEYQILSHADSARVSPRMRRMARRRSLLVLTGFTTAMLVAFVTPGLGFGLICAALILPYRQRLAASQIDDEIANRL